MGNSNKKVDDIEKNLSEIIPDNENTQDYKEINEKIEPKKAKDNNVVIYGFLKKESKHLNFWKLRFCILTKHYLFTFTGIEDDADCTMALQLSNVVGVEDDDHKRKKAFLLKCFERNIYLKAESTELKVKWMKKIRDLITKQPNKQNTELKSI